MQVFIIHTCRWLQRRHESLFIDDSHNFCRWANDGACDDPQYCAAGTDDSDCQKQSGMAPWNNGAGDDCAGYLTEVLNSPH